MKNSIQNVFMDQKSYEIIQDSVDLDSMIETILTGVRGNETQHQSIAIAGVLFEVEFHPRNDYFGFTFTRTGGHYICYHESCFKDSVYLYSPEAMKLYDDDFSGMTLLLYTTKKFICVIPCVGNNLEKLNCNTGKLEKL